MRKFTNRVIEIPKNEESYKEAHIRIETQRESTKIVLKTGGNDWTNQTLEIPEQFLGSLIKGLKDLERFIEETDE